MGGLNLDQLAILMQSHSLLEADLHRVYAALQGKMEEERMVPTFTRW
jgi:hypothetical protein